MNRIQAFFICLFILTSVKGWAETSHLKLLDNAIADRHNILEAKEKKIESLKLLINHSSKNEEQLRLLDEVFQEYLTYSFDSAQVYVQKSLNLSKELKDTFYYQQAIINYALLDARGGFYNEATEFLNSIRLEELNNTLKHKYYISHFWLYMYWSQYSSDEHVKENYWHQMKDYLIEAIKYEPTNTINWLYLQGEKAKYIDEDNKKAAQYYKNVVDIAPVNSKLYASAAFSLARCFMNEGKIEMYELWLTNSAISDVITPIKENLSLQELAMYLFEKNNNNVNRATNYIYCSMEDAQFFSNRLRLFELSKRFSTILSAYTEKINQQKSHMLYLMVALGSLTLCILASALYIKKQNGQLNRRREELQVKNEELHQQHKEVRQKNIQLEEQGKQLSALNKQLIYTNRYREGLAKVYIDLCAMYIDKLKKYQSLVKRRIKANQVQDLLSAVSSSRISEKDAAAFVAKFDKAFLNLYPTFVTEINALLLPDSQITLRQPNTLSNELRIYAFIRLGVKESSEIADLLSLSPQTIYNYRSNLKSKAVNKDTFEEDVQKVCTLIK